MADREKEEKKKTEDTARGIRALTSQLDGLTAAEDLDGVGKAGQQAYKDILRRVMTVIEEEIRHKLTGTRGNTPTSNTTPKPTTAQKRAPQTWAEKAAAGKATQAAKPKGTAQKAQANAPPALPETPKTSHRKIDENRLLATLFEDSNWKMVNPAVVKQRINRDLFKGEEVILRMTSPRTGFAFHAKEGKMDTEAKELIRNFLKAKAVGKETVWVKFVIPNVPKTINTIEEGKLVTRPTSMDDVKPDIQMAFGGDIKLMDWREYEHDPTMRGLRVAIHKPKECLGRDEYPRMRKGRSPSRVDREETQQRSKEKITVRRLKDLDQKTFADACKVAASEIQNALPEEGMNFTQALETAAEEITRAIQHAFKTATPQRQVPGSGYRWWNEDCSDGKKEVIRAKRQFDSLSQLSSLGATNLGEDLQIAKLNYKKTRDELKSTVMKASRKFYKDLVTGLKTLPEVHKAAKWVVNPQKTLSLALKKADGSLHSTPAEKIQILRERHLAGSGLPDVPTPPPPGSGRRATKEWTERNWDTSWQPGRDTETLTSTMTVSITNAHANASTASSRKNEDTCGRTGLYQGRGATALRTSY
ncbi:RNA-directed DNA polymerase from mobile element jockey [Ceratocystis lukuohia]|uniref:RNA-directed DNA polymerase from mobile element jockey n=1 Tax=Ceratocystis lukuohia TaxID=2019550 RepID=A0ABR4MJZ4_9PEZI